MDSKRGAKVVKVHQKMSAARYQGPADCAKRFKLKVWGGGASARGRREEEEEARGRQR